MFAAADPYHNIHKKAAQGAKRLAPILEARAAEPQQVAIRKAAIAEVLQGLEGDSLTVVDIGCGTGALARDVAQHPRVRSVIGVDPSAHFVSEAKTLAAGMPCSQKMEFRVGMGNALPVGNGSADVAIIWTVLVHVPSEEVSKILAAARRALKAGGRILVADNDLSGWSCSNGKYDPLAAPLAWFAEAYIQDPYLCHKLPRLLHLSGFAPWPLQLHTVVDTTEDSYGYQHVVRSAIDAFTASGCASPALQQGLRDEVQHRIKEKTFKVVLPYGMAIASVPGGSTSTSTSRGMDRSAHGQGQRSDSSTSGAVAVHTASDAVALPVSASQLRPPLKRPDQPSGENIQPSEVHGLLEARLAPLSAAKHGLLPGEELARTRPNTVEPRRPHARVRLFAVCGVADYAARLQGLMNAAPPWLEVRLIDLPGHGYRAKGTTTDGLGPAAFQQSTVGDGDGISAPAGSRVTDSFLGGEGSGDAAAAVYVSEQLALLVNQLVEEIWPLVKAEPANGFPTGFIPYALFGFSFGALVAYRLECRLRERGAPPALLLSVVGRVAPHCIHMPPRQVSELRKADADSVLKFVSERMHITVPTLAVGGLTYARAVALFRFGVLLNAVHDGSYVPSSQGAATSADTSLPQEPPSLYDGLVPWHAVDAAMTAGPIVAFSADLDRIARPPLVARWLELSGGSFQHATVPDCNHTNLRDCPAVYDAVYEQLAAHAVAYASSPMPPPKQTQLSNLPPAAAPKRSNSDPSQLGPAGASAVVRPPALDLATDPASIASNSPSPILRAASLVRAGSATSSPRDSPTGSPKNPPLAPPRDPPPLRCSSISDPGSTTAARPFGSLCSMRKSGESRLRHSYTAGADNRIPCASAGSGREGDTPPCGGHEEGDPQKQSRQHPQIRSPDESGAVAEPREETQDGDPEPQCY